MSQVSVMPFNGEVPAPKGRDRLYPLHTMEVGQFFFLPGRTTHKNFSSYISHQAKVLGRKFATRSLTMREVKGEWVEARSDEQGATKGIGVYRTE